MKALLYFSLFLLRNVGGCKPSDKINLDDPSGGLTTKKPGGGGGGGGGDGTDDGTGEEGGDGESETDIEIDQDIILAKRNFLVFIYDKQRKKAATAVRVLPTVMLSSEFINKTNRANMIATICDDEGVIGKKNIESVEATPQLGNIVVVRFKSTIEPVTDIQTVAINTRTDPIANSKCTVFGLLDEKLKFAKVKVLLVTNDTKCSNTKICAQPSDTVCIPPEGSALICNLRLTGIRVDKKQCVNETDVLIFSSLRFYDHWIATYVKPRGYFDHDFILPAFADSTRSTMFAASHKFIYVGSLLFLHHCFYSIE